MLNQSFRGLVVKAAAVLVVCCASGISYGQQVRVEVENLQPSNGFFFTPVWVAFHDGSFDYFDVGASASASLELLAEEGNFSGLAADFSGNGTSGAVASPGGFAGAPVIDPGETPSSDFTLNAGERFFSFASMIIPSNDGFIGNDSGTAFELFDAGGNFNGPLTIDIFASNLYDAGTEDNDTFGAPFSAIGGTSTTTADPQAIALHTGLDNFVGSNTAAGTTIGGGLGAGPVARITVTAVPEPGSAGLILAGSLLMLIKRRR